MKKIVILLGIALCMNAQAQMCPCNTFPDNLIVDGNVNINDGVIRVYDADKKLQLMIEPSGKIWAREVEVSLKDIPDFVFYDDYKLMSLPELKAYIQQHKHLPEVPSAKEIEANGINLGEFNKLLLQKIEELSLHIIRLDEEIQALKKQ